MIPPTLERSPKRTPYSRNQSWEERLWTKIKICGPDECWPWTGYLSGSGRQKHGAHIPWPEVVSKHEKPYVRCRRIVGDMAVLGEKP